MSPLPRTTLSNCAVRHFTADAISVGRCWRFVIDERCPIHGDVRVVQDHYARTGELTDETKLTQSASNT